METAKRIVQVKICGITRLEDALAAVDADADALGFVFHPLSPRYITPAKAAAIISELPPFTTTVGVFVNKLRSEIEQILQTARIQVIQLQGDESPEECADLGRPVIKAFRFNPDLGLADAATCRAQAVLVDSGAGGRYGGTGIALDWTMLDDHLDREMDGLRSRLILAGGLTPENVAEAIRIVQPRGVDVAGGVELEPGIKSHKKIREFIHAVKG
ncbi:MAG: phosphoribosylanthranilate isomerase [Desulfomonile sp.]|nr:phosphoribosylanthranilate isomerase [Desulfomonile sp.]